MPENDDDAVKAREARLLELVAQALEAGLVGNEEVRDRVVPFMAPQDDARDAFLGCHELPEDDDARSSIVRDLEARVGGAGRGTWAVTHREGGPWRSIVSDGTPTRHVRNVSVHDAMPNYADVYAEMVGYEAHCLRSQAAALLPIRAVARHGIRPGMVCNGTFMSNGGTFSTLVVSSVSKEGQVTCVGRRHRGRRDETVVVNAVAIVRGARPPLPEASGPDRGMSDGDARRWARLAATVDATLRAAMGPGALSRTEVVYAGPGSQFRTRLGAARGRMPQEGAPWTDDASHALLEAACGPYRDRAASGTDDYVLAHVLLATSARIAHAAVRGREGDLRDASEVEALTAALDVAEGRPAEDQGDTAIMRATAAAALSRMAVLTSVQAKTPARGDAPVQVLHAWQRCAGRKFETALGTTEVVLRSVPAADTRVACRLRGADGTWIELRMVGDALVRPVLSPGSWEPVDVATFAAAARDGAPWGDDPFAPRSRDAPLLGLREAVPVTKPRRDDSEAMRDASEEVRRIAAGLVVVGGVVHAPCPPPVAFAAIVPGKAMPSVGWSLPGQLSSTDDMRSTRGGTSRALRFDPTAPSRWASMGPSLPGRLASVPLLEAHRLVGLLRAHYPDLAFGDDVPFEILDAGAMPRQDDLPFEAMREWTRLLTYSSHDADGRAGIARFLSACQRSEWELSRGMVPSDPPDASWIGGDLDYVEGVTERQALDHLGVLSEWAADVAERLRADDPGLARFAP